MINDLIDKVIRMNVIMFKIYINLIILQLHLKLIIITSILRYDLRPDQIF